LKRMEIEMIFDGDDNRIVKRRIGLGHLIALSAISLGWS
jgi:hypothetical protein